MPRVLPSASVYCAFHRRSRLSHDTPQNLDVVAVGARSGSGATTADRSRRGPGGRPRRASYAFHLDLWPERRTTRRRPPSDAVDYRGAPGRLDPAREPSLLPFWAVTRDYFRWVDREDVALHKYYCS